MEGEVRGEAGTGSGASEVRLTRESPLSVAGCMVSCASFGIGSMIIWIDRVDYLQLAVVVDADEHDRWW